MQTRLGSFTETCLNIGSGFLVSMLVWQLLVAPLYGYEVTLLDNLGMTLIFTGVSIARTYVWRRIFNWWLYRSG